MPKTIKERTDVLLMARGLAPDLGTAQALILAGRIWSAGQRIQKPGDRLALHTELILAPVPRKFVSRGGEKLAGALDRFVLSVKGKVCLDVGASTGGFTDCLLRRGASTVIALDVGRSQLASELRNDPRVLLLEKMNVRFLRATDLPTAPDLITADLSFISLCTILPSLLEACRQRTEGRVLEILLLVKPQFEVQRRQVGKGGIVRDPILHQAAVDKVSRCLQSLGATVLGNAESPICGAHGNHEFFLYAQTPTSVHRTTSPEVTFPEKGIINPANEQ
jgi:23S rRNA (cytidine1920-2'-O)/16S rRNA (cytidine1409-2'-O)-methyltransferase